MLQLSDLTLEDIFMKITMTDTGSDKDAEKKSRPAPKLDLKVGEDGSLNAVNEEEKDTENKEVSEESNGGEE